RRTVRRSRLATRNRAIRRTRDVVISIGQFRDHHITKITTSESPPRRMIQLSPLTAILDDDAATRAGRSVLDVGAEFFAAGATFVQLRAKQRSSAWLLEMAEQL